MEERRRLERELADAKKQLALGSSGGSATSADEDVGGVKFSGQVFQGMDAKDLRGLLDEAKKRLGSGVAAIAAVNDGRAAFAVGVTDDLTGRFNAVDPSPPRHFQDLFMTGIAAKKVCVMGLGYIGLPVNTVRRSSALIYYPCY